jgi:hypothetical protein
MNACGSIAPQESWFRSITRSAAQIRKRYGVPDRETAVVFPHPKKALRRLY